MPSRLCLCVSAWGTWCAVACLLTGCANDGIGTLAPVSGKVSIDGAPLSSGAVVFHPDAAKGNSTPHEPRGEIDSRGMYTMVTAGKQGAPLGWYKVSVVAHAPQPADNPYAVPQSLIAAKFNDPESSGLEIEVLSDPKLGKYDLEVSK